MREILEQFAEEYSSIAASKLMEPHSRRNAYNPVIFVFVGDKITEAVKELKKIIDERWNNSRGIKYFHIANGAILKESWLHNVCFDYKYREKKDLREKIYKNFLQDHHLLLELNESIDQMKNEVLEAGQLFPYFHKLSISVITRADDAMNVITVPLTLIIKDRFQNSFNTINTDLYEFIEERSGSEDDGFNHAAAVSFFKEIELAQSKDFKYEEELNVRKSGIRYKVTNNSTPIYDFIYLLSDRNRRGILLRSALKNNAKVVAYTALLKNGDNGADYGRYNDNDFKGNIGSEGQQLYVSAGLSRLKRPDRAIAYAIPFACYEGLLNMSIKRLEDNDRNLKSIFKIDDASLERILGKIIPKQRELLALMDIKALENRSVSGSFKNMNLADFERDLYGEIVKKFFEKNYRQHAFMELKQLNFKEEFKKAVYKNIIDNPDYGLFSGYEWTGKKKLQAAIDEDIKIIHNKIKTKEDEISAAYSKSINLSSYYMFPWLASKSLYLAKEKLILEIYNIKLELLRLETEKALLEMAKEEVEELHTELTDHIENAGAIHNYIKTCFLQEFEAAPEYVGENIKTYYTLAVNRIIEKMSPFELESFMNVIKSIKKGRDEFCRDLLAFCRQFILKDKSLYEPFEEELHNRANSAAAAGEDHILTWEDLYNKIYVTLEESSDVHINIMEYSISNLYEEKYFLGSYKSKFIQYAFSYDNRSRSYKLGCLEEKNLSGIEKLRLVGGFKLENVRFLKEFVQDYEYFKNQGYKLYGIGALVDLAWENEI